MSRPIICFEVRFSGNDQIDHWSYRRLSHQLTVSGFSSISLLDTSLTIRILCLTGSLLHFNMTPFLLSQFAIHKARHLPRLHKLIHRLKNLLLTLLSPTLPLLNHSLPLTFIVLILTVNSFHLLIPLHSLWATHRFQYQIHFIQQFSHRNWLIEPLYFASYASTGCWHDYKLVRIFVGRSFSG